MRLESVLRLCSTSIISITALVAVVSGCSQLAAGPEVDDISPGKGFYGEDTTVVIEGHRFFPDVVIHARGGDHTNADFDAELVDDAGAVVASLSSVRWLDAEHIEALVPKGLSPGNYRLTVRDPMGVNATYANDVANMFVVTATKADHFEVVESWSEG
ncbi:MAG: hypothetical protein ACI9MC_003825, partial [Kiritimatiellia bacterium]